MLDVDGLTVTIAGRRVLNGVGLTVRPGETVAVVGPSGSGKSTLARAILGLHGRRVKSHANRLEVDGIALPKPDARAWGTIRGRRIGFVPQDPATSLNPVRRVGSQVREALTLVGRPNSDREVLARLAESGLDDPQFTRRYPHEMSGGQRQRVLIAIALAGRPGLVIADEPTSALDAEVSGQVLDLLSSQVQDGAGLLLITHDLSIVAGRADRVVVLDEGRVVEEGPAAHLLSGPTSSAAQRLRDAMPGKRIPPPVPETNGVVLAADKVSVQIGDKTILSDIDVAIRRGETVAVVGPSGSGKSTLARVLTGLATPTSGSVTVVGRVQLVAQNPFSALEPRWTVEQIVAESLVPELGLSAAQRRQRVHQVLDEVGLGLAYATRRPHELSGGQNQRVAIARALAPRPPIVVLDEAVSALDVVAQARVLDILEHLRDLHSTSYLFITHDRTVAADIAHRLIEVRAGHVADCTAATRELTP